MQSTYAARLGPLAMALVVLGLIAMPVPAHARDAVAAPSAGWHGRAIKHPRARPQLVRASWPQGWSAGSVGLGTGYHRPGGSKRVREVQRRLVRLGYRPGPVDGLFGPRTRAATRWFQYKHGLPVNGRVSGSTLVVLRARSEHEPLPTTTREAREPGEKAAAPLPAPGSADAVADDVSVTWAQAGLLILLALGLGVLTSLLAPTLRRVAQTPANAVAEPTPPPRARPGRGGKEHAGLDTIRSRTAAGLVVARLREFTGRSIDLVTLLEWLDEADAFLLAADHELDTSTPAGRRTTGAIIDLGRGDRRRIREWTRTDRGRGRFTPAGQATRADLTREIAAMHECGLSFGAIADALNVVGIPGPAPQGWWETEDVEAAIEERAHR